MLVELGDHGAPLGIIKQRCASGQLVEARNEVVGFFLSTDCEWLWCVDSDMGWEPDTHLKLLAAADPVERPVVGALCFGLKKQDDDDAIQAPVLRCFPTLYQFREQDDAVGFQVMTDYPRNRVVQVSASGAACFVVHRSVLEAIRDKYGPVWFDKITHPKGTTFSEDLSFFVRVAGVDRPVFVHTGAPTSHDKGGAVLTEARWDEQEIIRRYQLGELVEAGPPFQPDLSLIGDMEKAE